MGRILLVLLLVGCGQQQDETNHGYGWGYDQQSASGLRVRYVGQMLPPIELLDAAYLETAQCMQLEPPHGPLLIFANDVLDRFNAEGTFFLDTGTAVIDSFLNDNAQTLNPYLLWAFRHEMVHHILNETGFPIQRNRAHDSPFFESCAPR